MNFNHKAANNRVKRDARDVGFGLCRRPGAGAPYPKRYIVENRSRPCAPMNHNTH